MDLIKSFPDIVHYDVFCLTETWLKPLISSNVFFCSSLFKVFRNDRHVRQGGGVLIAVNKFFKVTVVDLSSANDVNKNISSICLIINKYTSTFIVVNIYLPPDLSVTEFTLFLTTLKDILILHNYPIFIFGDFNVPSYTKYINEHKIDSKCITLVNFSQFLDLNQYNFVHNKNDIILDLIYSNMSVTTFRAMCPLVKEDSHHPALAIDAMLSSTHKYMSSNFNSVEPQVNGIFNFRKARFDCLYAALFSVEWNFLNDLTDVNVACNAFLAKLNEIFYQFVPQKCFYNNNNRRYPPWFTHIIINDIRAKNNIFKKTWS